MKNLYFKRPNKAYLLIKENINTIKEALAEISAFLERHNYESHYIRYWTAGNDETTFDVGSWSEFFVLAPNDSYFVDSVVGTEKDFIDKKVANNNDL